MLNNILYKLNNYLYSVLKKYYSMIFEVVVMHHYNHLCYKNTLARKKLCHVVVGPATASGTIIPKIIERAEHQQRHSKKLNAFEEQYFYKLYNKLSKIVKELLLNYCAIIDQQYGIVISKISLILLQKEYIEQFYFEKRSGGGGSNKALLLNGAEIQQQKLLSYR